MNAIKREFKLHWRTDAILYAIYWGVFTLMVGVVFLIMNLTGSETYAEMGCFISSMFALILLLLRFVFWGPYNFNMAVSMGRTRTSAMLANAAHSAVLTTLFAVSLWLFHLIEKHLYSTLYPTLENEISFVNIVSPGSLVLIAAALWAVTFVLGAMITRYGKKAWWVVWAIWMFCCLILPRLMDGNSDDASILSRAVHGIFTAVTGLLGSIAPAVWIAIAVLAAAAALFAGVRMYLRAEVRD